MTGDMFCPWGSTCLKKRKQLFSCKKVVLKAGCLRRAIFPVMIPSRFWLSHHILGQWFIGSLVTGPFHLTLKAYLVFCAISRFNHLFFIVYFFYITWTGTRLISGDVKHLLSAGSSMQTAMSWEINKKFQPKWLHVYPWHIKSELAFLHGLQCEHREGSV